MEHTAPRRRPGPNTPRRRPDSSNEPNDPQSHWLRRILVAAGLALVVLILVGVAVYAAAFIMLAPMMQ